MGRDHRGAALRRGCAATRGLLLGALLVAVLAGPGSAPSYAADPTPAPDPTQVSTPSVSPPSEQQIKDARDALDRLRNQGKRGTTTPTTLAEVAGPTAPARSGSVTSRISDQGWWTIGAGLLVLLVLSETTRLSVRRAKHRRQA
jgi:hypothetical protein